ncbi:MAG: ABC transporter permease subunit [Methanobacteriaceae archaeon]|jgi:NitT/TauT family transport system permease protein
MIDSFIPQPLRYNDRLVYGIIGIIALIGVWQLLSVVFREIIVASPIVTMFTLWNLILKGELWTHLLISLKRLLVGLFLGSMVGLCLGIGAGLNRRLRLLLEPARWAIMTIPMVVIAVLGMLWFGMGATNVIFMVAIIVVPFTYVSALEGVLSVDRKLIEMANVFKVPRTMLLREVYLPGIGAEIMAGLTLAAGIGVRGTILSEFLGARDGIGHKLSMAWIHLNTPELFAWIIVCFALLGILEFGILKQIRDHFMKWKKVEQVTR